MRRRLVLQMTASVIIMTLSFPLLVLSGPNQPLFIPAWTNESPYEWPEGNPEEYGFRPTYLETVYSMADDKPYLYSILVVRHGKLVVEWYFNAGNQNNAFHIHSASKSFTSALIGIALHEGFLESVDQKLVEFFPEYFTPGMDPRKWNITIKHLLTMTAGFNFSEYTEEWIAYATSENWVQYAIELPLMHSPGEDWNYGTVQTNLLSAILTRATGMSTRDFANEYLFGPLNISISHWHQDPQGYYTGGHEMYFVPRDMARFGYLYLNNGSIDGNQLVPSSWVQESLTDFEGESYHYQSIGYGYQWWLEMLDDYITFSARGLGGQYIFCVPELDMVIVTTASGSIFDFDPNQQTEIRLMVLGVIVAVDPDYEPLTTTTSTTTATTKTTATTTSTTSTSTSTTSSSTTTSELTTTSSPTTTPTQTELLFESLLITGVLVGSAGMVAVFILIRRRRTVSA
ncbi:MAG: serine hydrolase [Candidatus Thorarchaeota archaeon]